jgi:hypothetical protein
MKTGFIQNGNYARFLQAVKAVESRGAMECGLMLVSGEPGLGKSKAVERWASDSGALYLRANKDMKHKFFLEQLVAISNVDLGTQYDSKGKVSVRAARTKNEIQARLTGQIALRQCPIVLDEFQHLLVNEAYLLEVVRDISDVTGVTVILVAGEEDVRHELKKYKQISSRIFKEVEFTPWVLQDIKLACKQLSEVPIEDALIERLTNDSKGLMRLVMNGISNIERIARANHKTVATLEDFAGKELVEDWDGTANAPVRPRRTK